MDSLSCWLQFCSILTLIGEFNTYVLFAANVDDFRNIARKIVPETLADKLARLASVSGKQKSRVDVSETDEYGSETELDKEESERDDSNLRNVNSMYVKDWETKVNFEELVERVKDRLANEMREEIQKHIGKTKNREDENSYVNKKTQNMASETNDANEETYGYNIDRDYSEKDGYKSKKYIDERFTKVTRNYEPITSYDDKYDVSEKIYSNKYVKPEYIDYQENHKQNYDDRDTQKYKIGSQKDYKTNIQEKDNSKDRERYVYDNYDGNVHNNKQYEIETKPEESRDVYDKYHKKDSQKDKENEFDNFMEIKPIKIHNHFKQTTPDINKLENKESLYNQFDLISTTKNDSYEDYVVPNKEENVFASEEVSNKRLKADSSKPKPTQKNTRFEIKSAKVKRPFSEWKVDRYNGKPDETNESVEIKAITESLWFEDHSKDTEIISETTKGKGTMIPTRETYKMSSPNYYISLPTVAERYDSEEPLPERDRERQIIKHFLNPPASINKKVRLLK